VIPGKSAPLPRPFQLPVSLLNQQRQAMKILKQLFCTKWSKSPTAMRKGMAWPPQLLG